MKAQRAAIAVLAIWSAAGCGDPAADSSEQGSTTPPYVRAESDQPLRTRFWFVNRAARDADVVHRRHEHDVATGERHVGGDPRALLVCRGHRRPQRVERPAGCEIAGVPVDPVADQLDPAVAVAGLLADVGDQVLRLDLPGEVPRKLESRDQTVRIRYRVEFRRQMHVDDFRAGTRQCDRRHDRYQ